MGKPYQDPSGRAKWLIRIIAVDMALTGVLLVDSLFILTRPRFLNISDSAYLWLITTAAGLVLAIAIVAAIAWLVWMFRCYDNVVALGESNEYSKPWVIFGWIIPIGSLWIPFQMTKDLAIDPSPDIHRRTDWPILQWWWGLFIALEYVSRIVFRLWRADGDIGEWPFLLESTLGVAVAPLAILVVAEVTRRQVARHAAIALLADDIPDVDVRPVPEPVESLGARWRLAAALTVGAMVIAAGVGLSAYLETPTGEVTIVDEIGLGDCTLTDVALSASVVDCTEPHLMQVVGTIDILDANLPQRALTVEFASGRCWQLFEKNTGISGFSDEYSLRIISPTAASWALGDRSAHCVVFSESDSPDLVGDLIAPSGRIPWTEMAAGSCYSFNSDFLSARQAPCESADLVVEAVDVEPHERLIETPFPGDDVLAERALNLCGPVSDWYYPDQDLWLQGDRSIVCAVPVDAKDT